MNIVLDQLFLRFAAFHMQFSKFGSWISSCTSCLVVVASSTACHQGRWDLSLFLHFGGVHFDTSLGHPWLSMKFVPQSLLLYSVYSVYEVLFHFQFHCYVIHFTLSSLRNWSTTIPHLKFYVLFQPNSGLKKANYKIFARRNHSGRKSQILVARNAFKTQTKLKKMRPYNCDWRFQCKNRMESIILL